MTEAATDKPGTLDSKTILGYEVRIEGTGAGWIKAIIDIPEYEGSAHWICTDAKEARDVFDCINEDKVFQLAYARKHHRARNVAYHRVGVAICRRLGLEEREQTRKEGMKMAIGLIEAKIKQLPRRGALGVWYSVSDVRGVFHPEDNEE